jgi:hypothetical protein
MKHVKKQVSPTEYASLRSKTEGRQWTLNAITRALREGRQLPGVIEIQKHSRFYLLTVKVDGDQLVISNKK